MGIGIDAITRPSLGRDVQLGMLYDARTETFFAGTSLWDNTDVNMKEGIDDERVQSASTVFTYSTEDACKLSVASRMIDLYNENKTALSKAGQNRREWELDASGGRKTLSLGLTTALERKCTDEPFKGRLAVRIVDVAPDFSPDLPPADILDKDNTLVAAFLGCSGPREKHADQRLRILSARMGLRPPSSHHNHQQPGGQWGGDVLQNASPATGSGPLHPFSEARRCSSSTRPAFSITGIPTITTFSRRRCRSSSKTSVMSTRSSSLANQTNTHMVPQWHRDQCPLTLC
ncbi:hypothetical protein J3F83DRAFT_340216 [Trichoderma novae-zelandiae]